MGDPFQKDSRELLTLDTKEIQNNDVVETTRDIVKTGREQCDIINDRFVEKNKSINDPIHKNKLTLCS